MNQFLFFLQRFFGPLSPAQRVLFVVLSIGVLAMFSVLSWWAFSPSYATLLSSLTPDTANQVVSQLEEMNVRYEIRDGGRTIAVPRDQVYELRLKVATTLPSAGQGIGYELFDQNTLGMTDFMQKLNRARALEGELSRTINSLEQVEHSRVHIVLPERSVFQRTDSNPTASVFLKVRAGSRLSTNQIEGIASLVAGSIEQMAPENVIILDQNGNRLSDSITSSDESRLSNLNLRIKREFEQYITGKGQTLLDRVLGPGNSVLKVDTDHNFERVIRDSQLIDPETRIIISEEQHTTSNTSDSQSNIEDYLLDGGVVPRQQDTRADETLRRIRNYEVSRARESVEVTAGAVTRISASVILNYKQTGVDENQNPVFEPRSEQEINQLTQSLASSLGITPGRGDQLSVTQVQFMDPFAFVVSDRTLIDGPIPVADIIQFVVLAIVFLIISLLLMRTFKTMKEDLPPLEQESASASDSQKLISDKSTAQEYQKKLTEDAQRQINLSISQKEAITAFVEENPSDSVSILRTLIHKES